MTYYWPFEGKVKLCFVLLKDDSKEAGNNTDDDEWGEKKEKVIYGLITSERPLDVDHDTSVSLGLT